MTEHAGPRPDLPLDEIIRRSLRQAAEPGDPTGVADAIRERLRGPDGGGDGGGGGTTGGPGRPGGGGASLPWVAAAAGVALLGGTGLGLSGLLGRPASAPPDQVPAVVASDARTVQVYECPGAGPAGNVRAGDRVLALGSYEDWAAIRDPRATDRVVWVRADALGADEGQADVADLPLEGCPEIILAGAEPTTEPTAEPTDEPTSAPTTPPTREDPAPGPPVPPAPGPGPGPDPQPGPGPGPGPDPDPDPDPGPDPDPDPEPDPGDATAPTLGQPSVQLENAQLYPVGCDDAWDEAWVSISAADAVGVASVGMTWQGGSASMSGSGGTWTGVFSSAQPGSFTVTITARDAAGNTTSRTTGLDVQTCLF